MLFSTLGIKHYIYIYICNDNNKKNGCIATDIIVLLLTNSVILVTYLSLLLTELSCIVVW